MRNQEIIRFSSVLEKDVSQGLRYHSGRTNFLFARSMDTVRTFDATFQNENGPENVSYIDLFRLLQRPEFIDAAHFSSAFKLVATKAIDQLKLSHVSFWRLDRSMWRLKPLIEQASEEGETPHKTYSLLPLPNTVSYLLKEGSITSSSNLGGVINTEVESLNKEMFSGRSWMMFRVMKRGLLFGVIILESGESDRIWKEEETIFGANVASLADLAYQSVERRETGWIEMQKSRFLGMLTPGFNFTEFVSSLQAYITRQAKVDCLIITNRGPEGADVVVESVADDALYAAFQASPSNLLFRAILQQSRPITLDTRCASGLGEGFWRIAGPLGYKQVRCLPVWRFENESRGALILLSRVVGDLDDGQTQIISMVVALLEKAIERHHIETLKEQARREALEASAMKSKFVAMVNHEIRTPLSAMLGYGDLLANPLVASDKRAKAIDVILKNGRYLLALVNDIVDHARMEAGKMPLDLQRFSIAELIDDLINLMSFKAQEKGVLLEKRTEYPIPRVVTSDPTRVRQVLINLIGNALKFTSQGSVKVSLKYEDSTKSIEVAVIDTGPGFDREVAQRIFEPFEQEHSSTQRTHGGSGLGLAISREIVSLLGGKIWVNSESGKGTTFAFTLPVNTPDVSLITEEETRGQTARDGRGELVQKGAEPQLKGKILLVDDAIDNRELTAMMLQHMGVEVEIASDGSQALNALEHHPFDLVLMDMEMPGISGFEATRRLRGKGFLAPIVALTAHSSQEELSASIDAGCNSWLQKPFTTGQLRAVLGTYLSAGFEGRAGEKAPDKTSKQKAGVESISQEEDGGSLDLDPFKNNPLFKVALQKFVDDLPGRKNILDLKWREGDYKEVRFIAHKLAGVGSAYGFPDLTRTARALDRSLLQDADCPEGLPLRGEEELRELIKEIDRIVS